MNNTSTPIQLLTLSFDLPLQRREITNWRGAFNELAQQCNNDIFHNHFNDLKEIGKDTKKQGGGYHYRHPLIQYRIHKRKAAILAINEGIDAMHEVLANHDWTLRWKNQPRSIKVADLKIEEATFELLSKPVPYRIRRWIALNQVNYEKWQKCNGLIQKAALLERILAAQLLALFSAFDWRVPARLEVQIQEINDTYPVKTHQVAMMGFDVSFTANVKIPEGFAIGRSVSIGYGQVSHNK